MSRFSPLTIGAVCAFVLSACAGEEQNEPVRTSSPGMDRALRALADLPIDLNVGSQQLPGDDAGFEDYYDEEERDIDRGGGSFGDSDTGSSILKGIGSSGPTGTAAGNGGVGSPTGAGNGGVGSPTGAGNGGVGGPTASGNGGAATAPSTDSLASFANALCDFLGALCYSFSQCTSESDATCDFEVDQCGAFVQEIIAQSQTSVTVPAGAVQAIQCVSNAVRSSGCILDSAISSRLESSVRSCGLSPSN